MQWYSLLCKRRGGGESSWKSDQVEDAHYTCRHSRAYARARDSRTKVVVRVRVDRGNNSVSRLAKTACAYPASQLARRKINKRRSEKTRQHPVTLAEILRYKSSNAYSLICKLYITSRLGNISPVNYRFDESLSTTTTIRQIASITASDKWSCHGYFVHPRYLLPADEN